MRKLVFWSHLVAGVVAGAVILMMSVTGVVLTYERQLIERAERQLDVTVQSAEPWSADELFERAKQHGARMFGEFEPSSLVLENDPAAAFQVSAGRSGKVYLDPYSGALLSTGFPRLEGFLSSVRGWHRWFNLSGESRKAGRAVTGAANLAFLAIVFSGLILWIPRRWKWRQIRAVLLFKRGLSGKARYFNWHNTIGIWIALPLVLIVASGVVISYRWAGDLVRLVTGDPATATVAERAPSNCAPVPGAAAALACAGRQVESWKSMTLSLPREAGAPARVRVYGGYRGESSKVGTLMVDLDSGTAKTWTTFQDLPAYNRARSFLRFAHTGEYWGLLGQTIAGIATLGTIVLVWTGLSLVGRRLLAFRARRRRGSERGAPELDRAA